MRLASLLLAVVYLTGSRSSTAVYRFVLMSLPGEPLHNLWTRKA